MPDRESLRSRVLAWHQGEKSGRTSTGQLINDLMMGLDATDFLLDKCHEARALTPSPETVSVSREKLAGIEWKAGGYDWCAACEHWKSEGHAPDCWLSAALARETAPTEGK